jgi:hypothetical protein
MPCLELVLVITPNMTSVNYKYYVRDEYRYLLDKINIKGAARRSLFNGGFQHGLLKRETR